MNGIRILLILALTFLAAGFLLAIPVYAAENEKGFLYAPYWTTEAGLRTLLVFNNPADREIECQLTLFGESGQMVLEHDVALGPVQSLTLSIDHLFSRPASGHLVIGFPAEIGRLPVVALIGKATTYHPVALLTERELAQKVVQLEALVPAAGPSQKTLVVVTNPSLVPIIGELRVDSGHDVERFSLDLGPRSTVEFSIRHERFDAGQALSLSLHISDPSEVMAVALSHTSEGAFNIGFSRGSPMHTRRLAGFYGGERATLFVKSDRADHARVQLIEEDGTVAERTVRLRDRGVLAVPLGELGAHSAAVSIEVEDPVGMRAWLAYADGISVQVLKDPERGLAYHAFPVRLSRVANTRILFFNPAKEEARFSAFFHFNNGDRWTLPSDLIGPGNYLEIDLGQLREELATDHLGRLLPEGALEGQVKVLQKGLARKKLLVQVVIDDRTSRNKLRLESCPLCRTQPERIEFLPGFSLTGFIGENVSLPPVMAYYDDGSSEDATFFSELTSYDTTVAQIGALHSTNIVGVGSTQIEASFANPFIEVDPICLLAAGAVITIIIIIGDDCDLSNYAVQSPDNFRISTEPRMPLINGSVMVQPTSATVNWNAQVIYTAPSTRCGGGPDFDSPVVTATGTAFSPDFGGFFGGALIIGAQCESERMDDTFPIDAINPTKSAIRAEVGDAGAPFDVGDLKRIACQESGQVQFVGSNPFFGPGGDAGIMQICFRRTSDDLWNWKGNIARGKAILASSLAFARSVPGRVRTRIVRGKGPYPDATNFTNEQLRKEAIHAYNAGTNINRNGYWQWDNDGKKWDPMPLGGVGGYVDNVLSKDPSCP